MNDKTKQMVGIIYSPGFGAGWSTWGDAKSALDQELAAAIQRGAPIDEIKSIAEENWPGQYTGGLCGARVEVVPAGTAFYIEEYDGDESLRLREDGGLWQVAI